MIIQQLFMGIIGWIARSLQCTFFLNCTRGTLILKPDHNKYLIHAVCMQSCLSRMSGDMGEAK